MIVFSILFCTITIIILKYYFTRTYKHWKIRNIKGPEPTIPFGNFKDTTLRKEILPDSLSRIYREFRDEPYVGIYRMANPLLMIKDLDLIKHIMVKDFDVFEDRGVPGSKIGLGRNLFSADGDSWRVLRHHFTPLFTTGKIKNMLPLITERGELFMDHVDSITQNEPNHEVHTLIQLYTVSTIAACAFGLDIDVTNNNSNFLNTLRKIDDIIFTKSLVQELFLTFPKLIDNLNVSLFPKVLTDFFKNLITTVVNERNGTPTNRNDFMDLILRMKKEGDILGPKKTKECKELTLEMTEEVMAAQAFVFYAAGYETSATTMTFMLYELAKNQHVQEKLHTEIDDILDESNGEVTYDTLAQLPYMEKVFDETLRKYPLLDPLQRRAKYNYQIPGSNLTIEKGQVIFIPVTAIHYDESIYPNPDLFDPERFDSKVSAQRHPCAYLPFGIGPRNCIGIRFAKVQSRVCMLKLLSRFRVELSDDKEMTFDNARALIGPRKGFKLRFISRNNKETLSQRRS